MASLVYERENCVAETCLFFKFKSLVLFIKIVTKLLLLRPLERMKISVDEAVTTNQCSLRKSTSKAQIFNSKILKTGGLFILIYLAI